MTQLQPQGRLTSHTSPTSEQVAGAGGSLNGTESNLLQNATAETDALLKRLQATSSGAGSEIKETLVHIFKEGLGANNAFFDADSLTKSDEAALAAKPGEDPRLNIKDVPSLETIPTTISKEALIERFEKKGGIADKLIASISKEHLSLDTVEAKRTRAHLTKIVEDIASLPIKDVPNATAKHGFSSVSDAFTKLENGAEKHVPPAIAALEKAFLESQKPKTKVSGFGAKLSSAFGKASKMTTDMREAWQEADKGTRIQSGLSFMVAAVTGFAAVNDARHIVQHQVAIDPNSGRLVADETKINWHAATWTAINAVFSAGSLYHAYTSLTHGGRE